MVKVSRQSSLVPEIIFVDGLSGTGKTILLMALSSMQRVEMSRFDHIYEYVCVLEYLGRVSTDGADVLIKTHADLHCYNTMISRSANFRPGDISSVLNSPQKSKYITRLFEKDHQDVVDRIALEMPIMNIMTHQMFCISQALFRALGDKMRLIEIVRDPLQMVTAWFSYIDRYGADPLELTICIEYRGKDLPWFAYGWEEEYLSLNAMDRSIKCMDHLITLTNQRYQALDTSERKQVLRIPFENFVTNPLKYLELIEILLKTKCTEHTLPILKEQNVPRKVSMDIPQNESIERYGYKNRYNKNETDALNRQWDFVKTHATKTGIDCMAKLHEEYQCA